MKDFGNWSLPPPPGFRGLDPRTAVRRYRGRLPHWRQEGATYFITFRLADSLPAEALRKLRWIQSRFIEEIAAIDRDPPNDGAAANQVANLQSRLGKATMQHVEQWLDRGAGSCLLRKADIRRMVATILMESHPTQCHLGAFVIMPNHIHALIRPAPSREVEQILRNWKRNSARGVNRHVGRQGSMWSRESYDRIVRDAEHLWRCVQYIGGNARRANLGPDDSSRWVCSDWLARGWGFQDPDPTA